MFSLKPIKEAAALLPEREKRMVGAATGALAREPLTAPWPALAAALDFAAPPPDHDTQTSPVIMVKSPLNNDKARAALATLAVRALRRRVLEAASRAGQGWTSGTVRGDEWCLLSVRCRELERWGAGWRHVADLHGMLPALVAAERPAAALAARLLESGEAQAWWGLREHDLRAALDLCRPGSPSEPNQPDEVQAAVDHARRALAELLGVSPHRVLISVAL